MATKKTTKQKRTLTYKEAESIIDRYYGLKNKLYSISENENFTDNVRRLAKKASNSLSKWRMNNLDTSGMSGHKHD